MGRWANRFALIGCVFLMASCNGGGGGGDDEAAKDDLAVAGDVGLSGEDLAGAGDSLQQELGHIPGTGAIRGSVKAEGARATDMSGAVRGGIRGGVRGGVRGTVDRGIVSRPTANRHPRRDKTTDECATFGKYGDGQCDPYCIQFDPDCKIPVTDPIAISNTEARIVAEIIETYAVKSEQGATFPVSMASFVNGEVKPKVSGVPMSFYERYDIEQRFMACATEHIQAHLNNGFCEDWSVRVSGRLSDYLASLEPLRREMYPGSESKVGRDLPAPEDWLPACFNLKDDADCESVPRDPCMAVFRGHGSGYSNGVCDTNCAMPDPECPAEADPAAKVSVAGAEVCAEGTKTCTYTNSRGEYELSGVIPLKHKVVVRKEGQSGQSYAVSQDVEVVADQVANPPEAILEETGSISGKALRAEASNHLGTDVFVPGTSFTAKTDEQGNFILLNMPVGTYRLAAMFPGFQENVRENISVAAKSDTKLEDVTLIHAPAEQKPRTVSGQVVDTDGFGVGGAIISTTPASEKVNADGNGNFVLKNLQPTSYVVSADRAGYGSNSRNVDLTSAENIDITILVANFAGRTTNSPPTVQIKGVPTAQPGETISLSAEVADPDSGDLVFVRWKANGGALGDSTVTPAPKRKADRRAHEFTEDTTAPPPPAPQINWTAPSQQGVFIVEANATDGKSAGFAFHLITVAQPGNTVRIDTTRPPMPDASLVSVGMNAPGKSDTISGAAKAVEPGATIKIYKDDLLRNKIAEGTVGTDGSFGPIDLGNNQGDANDLLYLIVYDAFGNKSDRFFFLNDKTAPDVTLTSQPCSLGTFCYVAGTSATFEFLVNEPGVRIECSFNQAAYATCSSPVEYKDLAAGNYSLLIRATDGAGNGDLSPAVATWGVDTVSPSAGTVNVSNTATATHVDSPFDLSTNFSESGSGIDLCEYCKSTDGTCDSEWTAATFLGGTCSWTGLTCTDAQSLTLNMRARDKKGNTGTGTAVARTCDTSVGGVTVRDAISGDQDIQTKTTAMGGSWTTASDASGVDHYEFGVGTTNCTGSSPSGITPYTGNGLNTSFSLGALSLAQGTTYFVNVKTIDKVGNARCDSSDGVIVVSQNVATANNVGRFTGIAVDSNGKIHVSYYDVTNGDLRYAYNTSGTWVTEAVDTGGDVGQYTSIALDSSNKAYISYYDVTNTALKYATNTSGSWVATTVDNTGTDKGQFTSLALDSGGKAHIAYYDVTGGDLEYATNASGAWVITADVDAGGIVGQYASIAIGTDGKAYVAYYDTTNSDPKYATNASGAWVVAPIDTTNLGAGDGISIALDSSNKAYVSYWETGNSDQRYATNASGSWVVSTQAILTGAMAGESSIKLDTNGAAHVCHWDPTDLDLIYSTNKSGSWTNSKVETAGNVGRHCSLALDPGGNPHISYTLDPTLDSDLKYIAVNP